MLEPMGGKSPSFSMDTNVLSFKKKERRAFALLCPAQGYPVPTFR